MKRMIFVGMAAALALGCATTSTSSRTSAANDGRIIMAPRMATVAAMTPAPQNAEMNAARETRGRTDAAARAIQARQTRLVGARLNGDSGGKAKAAFSAKAFNNHASRMSDPTGKSTFLFPHAPGQGVGSHSTVMGNPVEGGYNGPIVADFGFDEKAVPTSAKKEPRVISTHHTNNSNPIDGYSGPIVPGRGFSMSPLSQVTNGGGAAMASSGGGVSRASRVGMSRTPLGLLERPTLNNPMEGSSDPMTPARPAAQGASRVNSHCPANACGNRAPAMVRGRLDSINNPLPF